MKKLIYLFLALSFVIISCGEDKLPEEYLSIAIEEFHTKGLEQSEQNAIRNNISKALKANPDYAQAYYLRHLLNKYNNDFEESRKDLVRYMEAVQKDSLFGDGVHLSSNSIFSLEVTTKYKPKEEMFVEALLEVANGNNWGRGMSTDHYDEKGKGYWNNTEQILALGDSDVKFKAIIKKAVEDFKGQPNYAQDKVIGGLGIDSDLFERLGKYDSNKGVEIFLQMAKNTLKLENFKDKVSYRSKNDAQSGRTEINIRFVAHDSLITQPNEQISINQNYLPFFTDKKTKKIDIRRILEKKIGDIIDTLDQGVFGNRSVYGSKYNYIGQYEVIKIGRIENHYLNKSGNFESYSYTSSSLPWPYEVLIQLAKEDYNNCDLRSAFNNLNKAIDLNPYNYEAFWLRGDWYLSRFPRNNKNYLIFGSGGEDSEDAIYVPSQYGTGRCTEGVTIGHEDLFSKEKAFLDYAKAFELNSDFENIFNSRYGPLDDNLPFEDGTYERLSIIRDSISGEIKVSFADFEYQKPKPRQVGPRNCYFSGKSDIESAGKFVTGYVVITDDKIAYSWMDTDTQRTGSTTFTFDKNCNVINKQL
tara:strand:+ start:1149 stop:2903 length:1755 start_codon:yes stop_codon:yes gene_type:complete